MCPCTVGGGYCFTQREGHRRKQNRPSVAPGERGPDPVTSLMSATEAVQMIVNVPGPREGFLDDVDKVCLSWNPEQGTGKVWGAACEQRLVARAVCF